MKKSHSYSGSIKPKATIIKQDFANNRVATSLTDSEIDFCATYTNNGCASSVLISVDREDEEHEALLCAVTDNLSATNNNTQNYRDIRFLATMQRPSYCYRARAFLSPGTCHLSYIVPAVILVTLLVIVYFTREYAKQLLYWIENQDTWVVFVIFMLLFLIVSFPVAVGYFVLLIAAGYLFGFFKGLLTVILGANVGIAIAHLTIRNLKHHVPIQRIIKNETGRAILRVISGPKAFRVVLFTRLTPIPFGIQNAIFGVSAISSGVYHSATILGLLPAQIINIYLGSTLRSMHEVLNSHGTALTGYISFGVEVICGLVLMFWVVHKARKELSATLLSDINAEGRIINFQV